MKPSTSVLDFPVRLNKYLAHKGLATRTGADDLITKGLVTINGVKAKLGDKIMSAKDIVSVLEKKRSYAYFAYNKPVGIVTVGAQRDEKAILDVTRFPTKAFPLGRLDKDSRGLLIFTDDGRITKRLLDPKYDHEKEYRVRTNKPISDKALKRFSAGITIAGHKTKPAKVRRVNDDSFSIVLTEGKNRQIRRMCEAEGYTVKDLRRIRVMNILLDDIREGSFRPIIGKELKTFLASLGL